MKADGTVLYDTRADAAAMENHAQRQEVQQALTTGVGESSRYSATLLEKTLYYAQRLPDGTVLRLSATRVTWGVLLLSMLQPLLLVLVYALQDGSGHFTLSNVTKFFTDSDALSTFAVSIEIAIETTLLCILIGYPAAWILSNKEYNRSAVTIVLFIMPMWINALMRTLATAELFNVLGIHLGKGTLLYGMVYDYLPFMIYPIYNVLDKMDKSYAEAAQDLGATPWKVFWKVIVPLSMPGVASGVLMVFMPTVSTFAISEFLTNNKIKLFGTIIQENINSSMWNYGAALALIMLVIIGLTSFLQGSDKKSSEGGLV